MNDMLIHAGVMLAGVFLASVSQVMLKKAANKEHISMLREYVNPLVIGAYVLFFLTTLMSIYALQAIPLYVGAVLESTSYLFVTFWGWYFLGEQLNSYKFIGGGVIMLGILIFFAY